MRKRTGIVLAMLAFCMLMVMPAMADPKEGWESSEDSVKYYVSSENGLIAAVGLRQIGDAFYFFDLSGIMQTGWVQTADGWRYFMPEGITPEKGKMLTGLQKIGKRYYYFDVNGVAQTGLTRVGKYTWFFRKKGGAGVYGRSYMKSWAKSDGEKYYFNSKGHMVKDRWIKDRYVGSDGKMLKNTVTPDGYKVGADGKKTGTRKVDGPVKLDGRRYYFDLSTLSFIKSSFMTYNGKRYYMDDEGVCVTGWKKIKGKQYYFSKKGVAATGAVTIGGKDYYFNKKGVLQTDKTTDGVTTDENGVIISGSVSKPKVLVVSGHGQGDPGATSSMGQEYLKTREFAKMIVGYLQEDPAVEVEFYQNGSTAYDLYQRNVAALGTLASSSTGIKGTGSQKKTVRKLLKKGMGCAKLWEYDYVLEVHFNATGYGSKDTGGDGAVKGFGIYINQYKSAAFRKIDQQMVAKMRQTGFPIWARGTGIFTSAGLLNARTCQELGINYSLIETAFIDDRDDMNYYNANKNKMAKAIADGIIAYLK